MGLTPLLLVLLAGVIHASWNIAAKKAGGDARFVVFSGVVLNVFWAPVGLWFAWQQVPHWGWQAWAITVASGLLHWIYFNTLLKGYQRADLTVVYPMARGSGPMLSSIGAVVLLGEQVSALGLAGIVGIGLGVFFIAGGPALIRRLTGGEHDPVAAARVRAGLGWGVLTGCFIALYTVVDGYAVKVMALSPILLDYIGSAVRTTLAAPFALKDWPAAKALWRVQWRYALVVGIFSPISYVLVLYAATMAPLSHVAPAREISMLFAALIGGHLLSEGDRTVRIVGALLIAAGVAALGLAN